MTEAPDISHVSALDLDALTRLEQAATPGPWSREKPCKNADGFSLGLAVAATYGRQTIYANPPGGSFPSADANLIVALRNSAPALIAAAKEREALAADLAKLQSAYAIVTNGNAELFHEAAVRTSDETLSRQKHEIRALKARVAELEADLAKAADAAAAKGRK